MLTLKLITEETERVIKGLEKKHFPDAKEAVEKAIDSVEKHRPNSMPSWLKARNMQLRLVS